MPEDSSILRVACRKLQLRNQLDHACKVPRPVLGLCVWLAAWHTLRQGSQPALICFHGKSGHQGERSRKGLGSRLLGCFLPCCGFLQLLQMNLSLGVAQDACCGGSLQGVPLPCGLSASWWLQLRVCVVSNVTLCPSPTIRFYCLSLNIFFPFFYFKLYLIRQRN